MAINWQNIMTNIMNYRRHREHQQAVLMNFTVTLPCVNIRSSSF